jgi:hypothetical protein
MDDLLLETGDHLLLENGDLLLLEQQAGGSSTTTGTILLNAGSGGATFATISTSFSGDTANFGGTFVVLATGSEGSWTVTQLAGGAGAVSAGTLRATLAIDDPAVAALQIIDNCISGNEAQVDVVGALPAGTNNIGDVDVLTVPSDPFGANADAASATGSISAKLRFIASTGIPITGTVTVGSHAVTNAGTFVVQIDGTALTRLTDIETNTDSGAVVGNGAAATAQRVTLANDSTGIVALTTSSATIGKLAANSGVDIGDVDVTSVSGNVTVVQATASNLNATVVGTGTFATQATCTNAGTFAVQVTSLPASTNTIEVVGDAAHDAAIAGNPVRLAGRALTSNYTAVAAGDTADLATTILGKLIVQQYALPGTTWSYASANGGVTDTADDEAKAAGGAGVRQYVTRVQVFNGHASTSTEVVIKTASTVLWRGWAQAAGGGAATTFDPPLRGGDNEAINVANITNSSQTYFNLQGYTAAE